MEDEERIRDSKLRLDVDVEMKAQADRAVRLTIDGAANGALSFEEDVKMAKTEAQQPKWPG